jgi:predicted  nucleic acid-binding Zn-ribbon protein
MIAVCLICGVRFDTEYQYGYEGCTECGLGAVLVISRCKTLEELLTEKDVLWLKSSKVALALG